MELLSRQLRAKPLTQLPEPQVIEETGEPLLPSEILAESTMDLHNHAAMRLYPWLAAVGFFFWMLFLGMVLSVGSPLLIMFGALLALIGSVTDPVPVVTFLVVGAVGLVLSLSAVPAGVFWASRLKPRELISESAFQHAIAHRIALAFSAPMALASAVVAALFCVAPLIDVPSYWYAHSWFTLPNLFLPGFTTLIMFWSIRGIVRASNPFNLPTVTQLLASASLARTPASATRILSIVHAQDRRHLPPNTPRLNSRILARSVLQVAKTAVPLLLMAAPGVTVIVQFMSMVAPPAAGTTVGIGGTDFISSPLPPWVLPAVLLVSGAWLALAGPIPAVVMAVLRPKPGQVRDLRTYTTTAERFSVNDWERSAVHLSNLLIQAVTVLATVGYAAIMAIAGASPGVMVVLLFMFWFTVQPFSAITTHTILGRNLRQIVYGPAGLYMRRRTPIGAVTLFGMKRSDYADQPDVKAAVKDAAAHAPAPAVPAAGAAQTAGAAQPAGAPTSSTAPQGQTAQPAPQGQAAQPAAHPVIALPDFGASMEPYAEFEVSRPTYRDDYSIPEDLDSLEAEPTGRRRWFRRKR